MRQSMGAVPELRPAPFPASKHVPIIASVPGSSRSVVSHCHRHRILNLSSLFCIYIQM